MRIPVTQSDLNQGRLTKIARALQKALPNEKLGLMRAQNALAVLLGYRDLHDLQSCTTQPAPAKTQLSRFSINTAVGWKLFRHHGADLNTAANLAAKLHLQMLDVDAATPEASFERTQKEYQARGQLLVHDEFWDYANPSWNEKTPVLLDARIPGYSYAVLPNKTVFRWSLLEDLLSRLPADFQDDLTEEPRYKHLSDGKALEMAFITQELYPQACTSLLNTAKVAQILPAGFKIMWIFADGGDYMGECIGRVLHNEALGGIIPVIYPKDTDDIFEAVGQLLCGKPITARVQEAAPSDAHVYKYRFGFGGYDLAKDIRPGYGEDKVKASHMDRLPDHIRVRFVDGRPVLLGRTFVENGQTYLRNQNWMVEADVPAHILSGAVAEWGLQSEYLTSEDAIPTLARKLSDTASSCRKELFEDARDALQGQQGIANLVNLFFEIVSAADFDAYCDTLIDEDLPLRGEDDTQDREDLIEDRATEVGRMTWNGVEIKKACSTLAPLKDSSLGYILLLANGEYPGARHSSWVYPPKDGDFEGLARLMLGLVLHAVCCASHRKSPSLPMDSDALGYVVNRVLQGVATRDGVFDEYAKVNRFCKRLDDQAKFLQGIQKWRDAEVAMQDVRARGEFLYVGSPVGREKPKGLADLYSMARSAGFAPMLVEQKLSDFESAGITGSNNP